MSEHKPIYEWSLYEAIRLNEKDDWRISHAGILRKLSVKITKITALVTVSNR